MTDTPDRMITDFAAKLRAIYDERTAGDYTFTGFLGEFLAAVSPVIRRQERAVAAEDIAQAIEAEVVAANWAKTFKNGLEHAAAIARSHSTREEQDHE